MHGSQSCQQNNLVAVSVIAVSHLTTTNSPVLPVGRFSRQIGLVLETVGGEILRFGGWLVFGLVLNYVCGFLGG